MSTSTARVVLGAAGLIAAIVAVPIYMGATPGDLHPQPQDAPSVTRADPSPQWSQAADRARRVVRTGLAEQNLPGLSVAVGIGDHIVWAEGFGWADIRARAPVTPDTRFRIGTASTVLTSAAVGVLLEQQRLELDEDVQRYVPQFPGKQRPVTLRQLMEHRSGIVTESGDDRPLSRLRCDRPVDALPTFADEALLFEPGTGYRHSTYGWILVSAAIEAAAGQPFFTFMREQVLTPLAMDSTGAESATAENPDDFGGPGEDPPPFTAIRHLILEPLGIVGPRGLAAGAPATLYAEGWGPRPIVRHWLHETHPRNLSCYSGAMAFFSTPSDLVRFGLAARTSQHVISGELLGRQVVSMLAFPERGMVVAVMSNAAYGDIAAIARSVAEAFAG